MAMVKVKPKQGLKIRNPKNMEFLPEHGCKVEMSTYWARRIQCGDVVLVEDKKPAAPAQN